ncbi:MAG: pseudaminic acid synthase [Planctomycetes bacterium]|nr:pseudaminic acid synthase [Planctomycetota bacterium]
MTRRLNLGQREAGGERRVYIIAELSANHGQDYDQAVELIRAAGAAGADAIKLQTYTPDTITIDCRTEYFRVVKGMIWEGKNLYDLYGEAYTPWEWQPRLKELAGSLGMDCFSTPFDASAVDFLESMNVPAYKIASFELVDLPLIEKVARTGKPTIMSTGMATLAEIDEAVRAFRKAGGMELALLKCNSGYPALPEEMNLATIPHLSDAFDVPVGLSDHTLGNAATIAAVALGATIIERHFTMSRDVPGPDSAFSLEPHEFRDMVHAVRDVERALGRVQYEPSPREMSSRIFRRSLFVVQDVAAGELLSSENVRSIRPGHGLAPKYLPIVLGRRAVRNLQRGEPLAWNMISE